LLSNSHIETPDDTSLHQWFEVSLNCLKLTANSKEFSSEARSLASIERSVLQLFEEATQLLFDLLLLPRRCALQPLDLLENLHHCWPDLWMLLQHLLIELDQLLDDITLQFFLAESM
jgi:hypothetical protein